MHRLPNVLLNHNNPEGSGWPGLRSVLVVFHGDPLAGFEGEWRQGLRGDFSVGGDPKHMVDQSLSGTHHEICPLPINLNNPPLPLLDFGPRHRTGRSRNQEGH